LLPECLPQRLDMSASLNRPLTPEEYLAMERREPAKHEYYRGELFAMGGATRQHNLISGNISAALHDQLRHRDCESYQNDMRVKVTPAGLYTYPDIVVTCEKPRFEDDVFDTLINPQVIFEIVSRSSEVYDRGKKWEMYRMLDSLREYLVVANDRSQVDHYLRENENWTLVGVRGLESTINLPSIGCRLLLADIYAKVELSPPSPEADRAGGIYREGESR
jgi:Uma2 family endonuclease